MKRGFIIGLFSLAVILPGVFASGVEVQETTQSYTHIENGERDVNSYSNSDFSINLNVEEGNYYHCEYNTCAVDTVPAADRFDGDAVRQQDVNVGWGPHYKWP